jgi:hypothetical protein
MRNADFTKSERAAFMMVDLGLRVCWALTTHAIHRLRCKLPRRQHGSPRRSDHHQLTRIRHPLFSPYRGFEESPVGWIV